MGMDCGCAIAVELENRRIRLIAKTNFTFFFMINSSHCYWFIIEVRHKILYLDIFVFLNVHNKKHSFVGRICTLERNHNKQGH